MTGIETFGEWVHQWTGYPVIVQLGEQGSPMPPRPFVSLAQTGMKSQRISAPQWGTDPGHPDKIPITHRILHEETVRVTVTAKTEFNARAVIGAIHEMEWKEESGSDLSEKGLAISWISETISLGPGEEWAFADIRIWWAEDIDDDVYPIDAVTVTVTVT